MRRAAFFLSLAIPVSAAAQAPPPQQGIIERLAPPVPPQLAPPIRMPEERRATGPGETIRVRILRWTIQGNTAVPAASVGSLLQPLVGQTVTLAQVEDARLGILRAFREAGFPYVVVAAGLSPVPGGAELRVGVTEGYVAEVKLDGDIGPAGKQVLRFLDPLLTQRPVTASALERALLLVSDIPGVSARGVLRPLPGDPGALQLVVQLARRPVSGYVTADNRGYQLTGPWQALLVGGLNSFTSLGERTEVALLESQGNTQTFGQVSEEFFVGGSGLRIRLYGGAGRAEPGSVLAAIGYTGLTRVGGAGATYPVIRSRAFNLSVTGQFDMFESTVDTSVTGQSQRGSFDSVRALRVGADTSVRDSLLAFAPSAAVSTAQLRVSRGLEAFGASRSDSTEVGRRGSNFGFTKIYAEVSRNQPLFTPVENLLVSFDATLAGQYSRDVLPLSEKFYLGGSRLGRGFYSGQVTGDSAFGMSLELQFSSVFDIGELPVMGATTLGTQFYLFRDYGRTWENQAADPDRRLSSWGGGVRLALGPSLEIHLEGVHRITRSPNGTGVGVKRLDENVGFGRVLVRF